MKNGISAEICCGSLADCKTAQRCGADAIELITSHLLGGITPTAGLLQQVKNQVSLPVSAIVRPRAAGFCYSDDDFDVMCSDADELVCLGADGIVFGFLLADGTLDYERCARFMEHTGNCQTVFHRAIDVVENLCDTADELIKLGITRILTSGGKDNALDGAANIKALVEHCGDKIQILAGGGIKEDNIARVVAQTGVRHVHFGATSHVRDCSTCRNPNLNFGTSALPANESYISVNEDRILNILTNL